MNSRTAQAPYRRRPTYRRLQTGLRRTHQDAAAVLAADHRVGGRRADLVDVGDGQLLAAALAGALVQLGGADAALLRAQLVVELQQIGGPCAVAAPSPPSHRCPHSAPFSPPTAPAPPSPARRP